MAREDYTLISSPTLKIGVDMNATTSATRTTYAPIVYRYDQYPSWNSGGSYTEVLYVDGSEIGRWTLDFAEGGEESGWTRIDAFNERYVSRDGSPHFVKLRIYWRNFATKDSGGNWVNASDGYHDWTFTVPALYTITYNANGGSGSVASQLKSEGVAVTLASSGFTRTDYTLDGWATSASGGVAYALGASYTRDSSINLYAHWKILAPEDIGPTLETTRVSDTKVNLSWYPPNRAERVYIERSTDGAAFKSLGYVAGTASSYSDTSTSANHWYQYQVRGWNSTGYSRYSVGDIIYMTPAAPASVSGARAGDGTEIVLTVDNSGTRNATDFDVQYRASSSTQWLNATPSSSSGTPVSSITFTGMGGQSWYFRVRNTRNALVSAWTESGLVVPIQPPKAPTLVSPSSGTVIEAGSGATMTVTFEWAHNPVDGSAQTAAELQYKYSTDANWTTVSLTTEESKSVVLACGHSFSWRVRTKGVYSEFGPWSEVSGFDLFYPPEVSFLRPSRTVADMPIVYELEYLDDHGVFASGTLDIKLGGNVVYSEDLPATATEMGEPSPIIGEITTNEFLPSSGNTYTFEAILRSSDTITVTVTAQVSVEMGEPWHGIADFTNDPDTGYCNIEVGWRSDEGSIEPTYISLYRVTDEGRVLIGDDLDDGDYVLDKYAPLNIPYTYEIVTHAESGEVASVTFANEIKTDKWFAYWGNNVAWAIWNPSGSYSITRPEKTRVHYVGRQYPVSYDGTALDEAHEIAWTVVDMGEWGNGFVQLMRDGGRGVYKSVDGKVFHADFELTSTPLYTSITKLGTVSLSIVRIDGDAL